MSSDTRVLLCACAAALLATVCADSVCSEDIYGALQGTPHKLPEHYLLPRVFDWAVAVPAVCGAEGTAGVLARVCWWLPAPAVRVLDKSAAVVRAGGGRPAYLTVNVTVYCGAAGPSGASTLASSASSGSLDSASFEAGQSVLRATPLLRASPQPFWTFL